MGVAANELVDKVGVEWTFRILGFMLWAVCLPAAYCIKQPLLSKSSVPQLQWYSVPSVRCRWPQSFTNNTQVPLARTQIHRARPRWRNCLLSDICAAILYSRFCAIRKQLWINSHRRLDNLERRLNLWARICRLLRRLIFGPNE